MSPRLRHVHAYDLARASVKENCGEAGGSLKTGFEDVLNILLKKYIFRISVSRAQFQDALSSLVAGLNLTQIRFFSDWLLCNPFLFIFIG